MILLYSFNYCYEAYINHNILIIIQVNNIKYFVQLFAQRSSVHFNLTDCCYFVTYILQKSQLQPYIWVLISMKPPPMKIPRVHRSRIVLNLTCMKKVVILRFC